MPITFTEADFADAPAEKLTFTEADFAPEREDLKFVGDTAFGKSISEEYSRRRSETLKGVDPLLRKKAELGIREPSAGGLGFNTVMTQLIEPTAAAIGNMIVPPRKSFVLDFSHGPGPTRPIEMESEQRFAPGVPMITLQPDSVIKPDSSAARIVEGFSTPGQAATLPFTLTKFAKPIQALYAGTMAEQLPESLKRAFRTGNRADIEDAAMNAAMLISMGHGAMKGESYAPQKGSVKEGRVGEYPRTEAQRTTTETGRGNRPAPATGLEKETQVSLTPEEQAYLDAEREGMKAGVEVGAEHLPADQPFASGEVATINRETGKVVINPVEFKEQLAEIPPERRQAYVRSLLAEEENHLATESADADAYVGAMTKAELAMERRAYTGKWTAAGAAAAHGKEFSDRALGYEAIRRRMQQLARMSPTEVAMAVGKERWKMETLNVLQRMVSRTMETLPTERSELRRAILKKVQGNLDMAKFVAAGGNPSSLRRPRDQIEEQMKMDANAFVKQFGTGKAGLTSAAYRMGERITAEEIPELLALREKVSKQDMADLKAGKPSTMGMKGQYIGEAVKWRQALDEARATGASTLEDFAELEKKYGVGEGLAKKGEDLKRAFDAEEPTVEGVTSLDPSSGRELTATEGLVHKLEGPSSIRRPKAPKEHPELFLPPKGKGTLSKPETEPTSEMVEKARAASYQPITPAIVGQEIQSHLTQSPRPNFQEFSDTIRTRYGSVQPEQLREAWRDSVWKHLMQAPGAELGRLYRSLGLLAQERGSITRTGKPGEVPRERFIPDAPQPSKGFQLEMQPVGEAAREIKLGDEQARQRERAQQNYRAKVQGAIGLKLIQESETGRKAWNRKEVSPEDIGFWRASSEPAWNTITSEDIANPEVLGRTLTSDAREEASTRVVRPGTATEEPITVKRKAPPVSVTKRLTAMLNKRTGEVDLVSTYRDGRRGAVLYDPQAPDRTHSDLKSMLSRYRPLQSILLDEPVQNFHKRFSSVREFEEQFGAEARNRAAEYAAREAELEPGAGILTGAEEAPSALSPGQRLTDQEAGSLFDAVHDEVGKFEGPEDVGRLVEGLHERMTSGKIDTGDWAAVAALEKIYNAVRRQHETLTPEQAITQTYDEIADIIKRNAEDRKGFQEDAVGKYSPEVSRPVGSAPPPPAKPVETGARELSTMRDVPPTVDPNVPVRKGPGPEPTLPEPEVPELMSPEDRRAVAEETAKHEPPRHPEVIYRQLAQRKVPKEPYTAAGLKAPFEGEVEGETLPEGETIHPEEREPSAIRRAKTAANDEFSGVTGVLRAWKQRRATKAEIVAARDAADNTANNAGRAAGDAVRAQTGAPTFVQNLLSLETEGHKVRAAAKAVIAAGKDKNKLDGFLLMIDAGRAKAERLIETPRPSDPNKMLRWQQEQKAGQRWLKAANKLREEVEFAKANWRNPQLWRVVRTAQRELKEEFEFEAKNGINLKEVGSYVPGRYDAEFYNDSSIMFGDQRVLGRNFRKPKAFQSYYSAIQAGPYIPKTYDLADLVEHRVRQGRKQVNKQLWLESMREVVDPVSKQPIVENPRMKDGVAYPANTQSELFSLGPNAKVVSVREGYRSLLDVMTMQGGISKSTGGQAALAAVGALKHGVILILDSFHPARLGQYAFSLMGKEAGFRGGWSALDYNERDLPQAIKNGWVSEKSAKWANEPVGVLQKDGSKRWFTRRQILDMMQRQGLNVGRIQDAIYSDMVRKWPVVGALNRWTFDVMTRGLMAESAVRSFEKMNGKYPNMDPRKLMRDVVRDVNFYYGSIGRQGWIRNPTFREVSQLLFLAPQWVEGLVQKEVRTAARVATAPVSALRGTPMLGVLGSGMAKGLVGYLALTQVLNMITRGKTTFQNPEEDHKLDAWIPTGENTGFWLSPMSVFAEVTHDILRLGQSKPTVYDAIRQVGANKLSPLGRMAFIFVSRENQQGQRITSTGGMIGEMAKQLAPAPISLGTPARALGHAIAPGLVSPPPPGALQQRLLGAAGIKVQPGQSAIQQAQHFASQFMEKNGLKPETGFVLQPTDEASYSKLRSAIINGDQKAANWNMEQLRKTHSDEQILKAMKLWSKRPMTGSNKGEMLLLEEMSDDQFKVYEKALEERQKLWNDFVDFYLRN